MADHEKFLFEGNLFFVSKWGIIKKMKNDFANTMNTNGKCRQHYMVAYAAQRLTPKPTQGSTASMLTCVEITQTNKNTE